MAMAKEFKNYIDGRWTWSSSEEINSAIKEMKFHINEGIRLEGPRQAERIIYAEK